MFWNLSLLTFFRHFKTYVCRHKVRDVHGTDYSTGDNIKEIQSDNNNNKKEEKATNKETEYNATENLMIPRRECPRAACEATEALFLWWLSSGLGKSVFCQSEKKGQISPER